MGNAPGFQALKDDKMLKIIGIDLDFGRIKNKNGNACVDKIIRELKNEIKRLVPEGGKISSGTLAIAISSLNHRVRPNGLKKCCWNVTRLLIHLLILMMIKFKILSLQNDYKIIGPVSFLNHVVQNIMQENCILWYQLIMIVR